jgi:hypothetical protein
MIAIIARAGNLELVQEWDQRLADGKQQDRRLQLLTELLQFSKKSENKVLAAAITEALIQAHLHQGKWSLAFPLLRELLVRSGTDTEVDRWLGWLHQAGEQALKEGKRAEVLQLIQEVHPFLARHADRASAFEQLEKQARKAEGN